MTPTLHLRNAMDRAAANVRNLRLSDACDAELEAALEEYQRCRIDWEAALMTESPERHEADHV